jgi:hypothetical protein
LKKKDLKNYLVNSGRIDQHTSAGNHIKYLIESGMLRELNEDLVKISENKLKFVKSDNYDYRFLLGGRY